VYFPKRVDALCGRKFVAGDGGEAHTILLSAAGDVFSFGRSAYGRLGLPSVDPKDDEPHYQPGHVLGVPKAIAVAAGASVSGAITESGEAYVWGYGDLGQLGRSENESDAMTPERLRPTKKMGGDAVSALSFGGQHAALICVPADTEARAAKRAR
jgi:regulator of chromosome condensation